MLLRNQADYKNKDKKPNLKNRRIRVKVVNKMTEVIEELIAINANNRLSILEGCLY